MRGCDSTPPQNASGNDSNAGLKTNQVKQLFSEILIPSRKFPGKKFTEDETASDRARREQQCQGERPLMAPNLWGDPKTTLGWEAALESSEARGKWGRISEIFIFPVPGIKTR